MSIDKYLETRHSTPIGNQPPRFSSRHFPPLDTHDGCFACHAGWRSLNPSRSCTNYVCDNCGGISSKERVDRNREAKLLSLREAARKWMRGELELRPHDYDTFNDGGANATKLAEDAADEFELYWETDNFEIPEWVYEDSAEAISAAGLEV